jgi:hypothetical protein
MAVRVLDRTVIAKYNSQSELLLKGTLEAARRKGVEIILTKLCSLPRLLPLALSPLSAPYDSIQCTVLLVFTALHNCSGSINVS